MTMKTNSAGLKLIKLIEGLYLKAYKRPSDYWTVGYGHTSGAGAPKVVPGMKITRAQAESILAKDLGKYERCVERAAKQTMTSNQFSAFVSFAFNVGCAGMSGSSAMRAFNAGENHRVPGLLA